MIPIDYKTNPSVLPVPITANLHADSKKKMSKKSTLYRNYIHLRADPINPLKQIREAKKLYKEVDYTTCIKKATTYATAKWKISPASTEEDNSNLDEAVEEFEIELHRVNNVIGANILVKEFKETYAKELNTKATKTLFDFQIRFYQEMLPQLRTRAALKQHYHKFTTHLNLLGEEYLHLRERNSQFGPEKMKENGGLIISNAHLLIRCSEALEGCQTQLQIFLKNGSLFQGSQ